MELDWEQVDKDGPRRQRTSPCHPRNQQQEQDQSRQEQSRQEQDQLEQQQEQEQRMEDEAGPQPAHTHGPHDWAACSAGTSPRGDRLGADDQILYK